MGEDDQLYLSISYGTGENVEVGDDELNENRVDKVELLFFKDQMCVYYPTQNTINITEGKMEIVIPDDKKYLFDNVTRYTIVAVANSSVDRSEYENKTYQEVCQTAVSSDLTKDGLQPNFIMFGETQSVLSRDKPNMGAIELNRLASKTTVKITDFKVDGFTVNAAYASMVNCAEQTAINDVTYKIDFGKYKTTTDRQVEIVGLEKLKVKPFYSYANDWSDQMSRTSYISLTILGTDRATLTPKKYYYKIPFFVTENETSKYTDKILGNYYYNFSVNINKPGGETPETAIKIKRNVQIINWYNNEIEVDINQYKYLNVEKNNFEMLNEDSQSIKVTSNADLEILNVEAKCSYINDKGIIKTIAYKDGDEDFPSVRYEKGVNKILISSKIPNNYLTKQITFRIATKGSTGVYEDVTIDQQPPIVVSSTWAQNSDPDDVNKNIYKIRVVAITNDKIFDSFNDKIGRFLIGDATEMVSGELFTKQDKQSNRLTSGEFVISPQTNNPNQEGYYESRTYCNSYKQAPYTTRKWRVPTQAEILLIGLLQNDPNSPVKNALERDSYWTACTNVAMLYPSLVFQQEYYSKYVRCVYDTWK